MHTTQRLSVAAEQRTQCMKNTLSIVKYICVKGGRTRRRCERLGGQTVVTWNQCDLTARLGQHEGSGEEIATEYACRIR
jgi:hypothetical protein